MAAKVRWSSVLAEQIQQLGGRVGHDGLYQQRRDADGLAGDVEDGTKPRLIRLGLALAQNPRLLGREVFVRLAEHQPDRLQGQMHRLRVETGADPLQQAVGRRQQLSVGGGELPGSGTTPSRFLATIDNDRCARLPSSLAKSVLIRVMIASSL